MPTRNNFHGDLVYSFRCYINGVRVTLVLDWRVQWTCKFDMEPKNDDLVYEHGSLLGLDLRLFFVGLKKRAFSLRGLQVEWLPELSRFWGRLTWFNLNVALPSRHAEIITYFNAFFQGSKRQRPTEPLGNRKPQTYHCTNRVILDPDKTLEEAEIEDGECLAALVPQPKLAATHSAFTLRCHGDGAIVAWGDPPRGRDSPPVRDQQIQGNWGREDQRGDSSLVRDQPKSVRQILNLHDTLELISN